MNGDPRDRSPPLIEAGWGSGCIVLWSGLWTLTTGVAWAGSRFALASGSREGACQVLGFITCTTQLPILPPQRQHAGVTQGVVCTIHHGSHPGTPAPASLVSPLLDSLKWS